MSSIRIFEAVDGKLLINDVCLRIPELKAIVDRYKDPMPALSYIDFMTAPDSPFNNIPEEDKQQTISDDVGGDFGLEDVEITEAITKLTKLYETPTMRYYNAIKKSLDMTSAQLESVGAINFNTKDGNAEMIDKMQMNAGKKIEAFKKLEKIKDEEIKVALRGKAQSGMY